MAKKSDLGRPRSAELEAKPAPAAAGNGQRQVIEQVVEQRMQTIRHAILTITPARINTFVGSDLTLTQEPS